MPPNNTSIEKEVTLTPTYTQTKEKLDTENEECKELLLGENMKRLNKNDECALSAASTTSRKSSMEKGGNGNGNSINNIKSFVSTFSQTSGPPQIALLCLLYALALGSTVGVIPSVMTNRYARINHEYDQSINEDCSFYTRENKPIECRLGAEDALNATAIASFISNMLTFLSSAIVGSISDRRGRKGVMIVAVVMFLIGPSMLVLIQIFQNMNPFWYYAGHSIAGLVNWLAVALSSLSDVIPQEWRASSFGLLIAGYSCGFAFSPMLTLCFSHFEISVISWSLMLLALVINVFCIPETLPCDAMQEAKAKNNDYDHNHASFGKKVLSVILRPFYEMSILNRDSLFRYLSALAFFSGMVTSGDSHLLIYYLEDQLDFNDKDISLMFIIIGMLGIIIQGFCIKPLQDLIGERFVLVVSFSFGAVSNFIYGIASTKKFVFVGIIISTICGMSFPTISAIKANNVNDREQGRIQGALFSLQSLASALGPISLRFVYSFTKDYNPGIMFIFASFLLCIAVCFALALPTHRANSKIVVNDQQQSNGKPTYPDDNYLYGSL